MRKLVTRRSAKGKIICNARDRDREANRQQPVARQTLDS